MSKFKRLKYLALPLIGGALALGSVYGASSLMSLNNNSNTSSVMNFSEHNSVRSKSLNDYVIGSDFINISSVVDSDGNYILPAKTKTGDKASVVKLSQSGAFLGSWEFNTSGYVVREIVKDTDDLGYYYVLIASKNVEVTGGPSNGTGNLGNASFSVENAAKVVQIKDEGNSFSINNIYSLEIPEFSSAGGGLDWSKIYIEEPASKETGNADFNFIYTTNTASGGTTKTGSVAKNDVKRISETWSDNERNTEQSVMTKLYDNSARNMAYISHNDKKMILIFGGSDAQSLWFYDFFVSTSKQTPEQPQTGFLYANYEFDFNTTADGQYDINDTTTYPKAYEYKALNNKSKTNNIAWFVGGAKTVTRKNNSFVLLSMMEPNFSNYDHNQPTALPTGGVQGNSGFYDLLVGASSINSMPFRQPSNQTGVHQEAMKKWNKGSFRSRTIWTSVSSKTAYDVAGSQGNKIFDTSASNTPRENFSLPKEWTENNEFDKWNYFSKTIAQANPTASEKFAGSEKDGDGFKNSVSQKIILFDPQIIERYDQENPTKVEEEIAALTLVRGQIGLIMFKVSNGVVTANLAKDAIWNPISYLNESLDFDNLKSVTYRDNTWFLNYVEGEKSQVYALAYNGHKNNSPLISFSTTTIVGVGLDKSNDKSEMFYNVLPVSDNSLFTVNKRDNHKVVLWNRPKGGLSSDFNVTENFSNNPDISQNEGMWGTIKRATQDELSQRNLLSKPAVDIVSDPDLLSGLVDFTPGWDGQGEPLILNAKAEGNNVSFDVALQHPNGLYYTSTPNVDKSKYPNVVTDASIGNLSYSYDGFSALPAWVLPTAIGGGVGFLLIIGTLGVVFGVPMYMSRKLQEKGFTSTFNKVDNLTAAVGSVYKKIVAQTGNVKKQPQMLKAAKPATPGAKPAAPGAAPKAPGAPAATRPVGVAPKAPGAPTATRPVGAAPKAPGAPAAPRPAAPTPKAPS